MTYGSESIYLDHAATTPVDPAVVQTMMPFFSAAFGNPSSIYRVGQEGRAALDRARASIAHVLGCRPSEILFTSGATESGNLAIKGIAAAARQRRSAPTVPHVITTAIEHHAVLHPALTLEEKGYSVTQLPVDDHGFISVAELADAIRPETCLVSIIYANNEIGVVQPVSEVARVAKRHGVPLHVDAVQAAGSLPIDVNALGVDLLTLSAHKFYGPKGVGVLYIRQGTPIRYLQDGGGQESGRRGGTENVPLIVGMAEALVRADRDRETYNAHCRALRDRLWNSVRSDVPDVILNGPDLSGHRLVNNLNISFRGVQGETALLGLDMAGVAASAGSACTTGNSEPSHVLRAIGLSTEEARASMRFTVGRGNSEDEIDDAADAIAEVIARTRALAGSPV